MKYICSTSDISRQTVLLSSHVKDPNVLSTILSDVLIDKFSFILFDFRAHCSVNSSKRKALSAALVSTNKKLSAK